MLSVDATEELSSRCYTVFVNPTAAMGAVGCQRMDRALEAVERVPLYGNHDVKRLVIIVLANFAYGHTQFVRARRRSQRCFYWESRTIAPSGRHHRCRLQLRRGNFSGLE